MILRRAFSGHLFSHPMTHRGRCNDNGLPQLRNHRIGGKVLTHMEQHFPQLQLLEVEPPTDEITRRRIAYYERNGFRILNRDYLQPPYSRPSDENPGFPLWIMGRGTAGNIEENIRTIHQEVYIAPYSLDE